jgi:hypothetical protein
MDLQFGSREDASTFTRIAKSSTMAPSASLAAGMNVVRSLSEAGILVAPVCVLQEIIVELTLDSRQGMSRADRVLLVTNGSLDPQSRDGDILASSVQTKEDGTLVLRLLMLTPLEASLLLAAAARACGSSVPRQLNAEERAGSSPISTQSRGESAAGKPSIGPSLTG